MDRLEHYRQSICQFLDKYVEAWREKDVETQLVIDSSRDHYLLLRVGWEGEDGLVIQSFILISRMAKSGFKKIIRMLRLIRNWKR